MNKYEWLEAVMASKMPHAVKTFAFGLYKHMNKENTCFPGDEALMEACGMGRGHFSQYRRTLIEGGWVTVETRKTKNGNSYTYTASLPPTGNQSATYGEQNATSGEQTATSGGMNTLTNTAKNTLKNIETGASAPVVETRLSKEGLKEDNHSSSSSFEERRSVLKLQDMKDRLNRLDEDRRANAQAVAYNVNKRREAERAKELALAAWND